MENYEWKLVAIEDQGKCPTVCYFDDYKKVVDLLKALPELFENCKVIKITMAAKEGEES